MKSRFNFNNIVFLGICLFFINKIDAQCTYQVFHVDGTTSINGIDVTVSSSGVVDTISTYCPEVTQPYLIGCDWATGISNDGSYTFMFYPPVDSLTLNFSGIGIYNDNSHQEIVKLIVNGIHYAIPSVGSFNNCDSLAILTSSGDITGSGGWLGTSISGPITSLTVLDSVVSGTPLGAVFSLFICNKSETSISETENLKLKIFPIPAVDKITIENIHDTNDLLISIYNMQGLLLQQKQTRQMTTEIDISGLTKGFYFLKLSNSDKTEMTKFVKE